MASRGANYWAPSATSTWLAKSGPGTFYGVTVANAATGGTVVVADLLNVGANPNMGIPSTFGPNILIAAGPFPANTWPLEFNGQGRPFSNGLSVSLTSTVGVVVHFD